MLPMKIVLLEDDAQIARHLFSVFEAQGWSTQVYGRISDLLTLFDTQNDFDIIILDRLLPDGDSTGEIKAIKKKVPLAKIIILSSLDFPKEKAKWLSEGADEYMGKPVFSDELVARINLLRLRSSPKNNKMQITLSNLTIDLVDRVVICQKNKIDFTAKEYSLLLLLAEKPGRIFNKLQILEHVWGYHTELETNVVESTINHVRRKLELAGSRAAINNKRNLGYWIEE